MSEIDMKNGVKAGVRDFLDTQLHCGSGYDSPIRAFRAGAHAAVKEFLTEHREVLIKAIAEAAAVREAGAKKGENG